MISYFIKKLLILIPTAFLISFIIFCAVDLSPTDPISFLIGPDDAGANEQALEELRIRYGFYDPLIVRYGKWVGQLLKGNMGYSIVNGTPIKTILVTKLPATIELASLALLFSTIIGITIGILSAIYQNRWIDYLGRFIGVLGVAIPQFFFALALMFIFGIKLDWLPCGGRMVPGYESFFDRLPHLILPTITMSIGMLSALLRYSRNSMLDILNSPYINTARSKGIPEWKVYLFHAFRNAMGPVMVTLCFRIPILVGGSVVIESIFSWPGIGVVIMQAIVNGDYPVIMVTTLLIAIMMLVASFLVDMITALLDPRVRANYM